MHAELLYINSIKTSKLHTTPYKWGVIVELLSQQSVNLMIENFPNDHLEKVYANNRDKTYTMLTRPCLSPNKNELYHASNLHQIWHDLVEILRSKEYTMVMSEFTGYDLSTLSLEIAFWQYGPQCWLSPHCDKPNKVVTQLFYFNDTWEVNWGGTLRILNSKDVEDIATEIVPLWKNSAVLVRSDASWHAVTRVDPSVSRNRHSLQIVWKHETK